MNGSDWNLEDFEQPKSRGALGGVLEGKSAPALRNNPETETKKNIQGSWKRIIVYMPLAEKHRIMEEAAEKNISASAHLANLAGIIQSKITRRQTSRRQHKPLEKYTDNAESGRITIYISAKEERRIRREAEQNGLSATAYVGDLANIRY